MSDPNLELDAAFNQIDDMGEPYKEYAMELAEKHGLKTFHFIRMVIFLICVKASTLKAPKKFLKTALN